MTELGSGINRRFRLKNYGTNRYLHNSILSYQNGNILPGEYVITHSKVNTLDSQEWEIVKYSGFFREEDSSSDKRTVPQINYFPNPVGESLTVNISHSDKDYVFRIFDFQKRKVLESILTNESNILNLSGLQRGIYIIEMEDDHGKILVETLLKE